MTMTTQGDRIRQRRKRLGMTIGELAEEAGVNRDTLSAVESGARARENTIDKLDAALSRIEDEAGVDVPPAVSTEAGLVEFEVSGDFGVRVVVRGPITDATELEKSVARLIRDIRENRDEPPEA